VCGVCVCVCVCGRCVCLYMCVSVVCVGGGGERGLLGRSSLGCGMRECARGKVWGREEDHNR
jgi:hypothetical protein